MSVSRKIIITGATGFIGSHLARKLHDNEYDVVSFTRSIEKSKEILPFISAHVLWQPGRNDDEWFTQLEGAKAIVNLAGASIGGGRWTGRYKRIIIDSRTRSTGSLANALSRLSLPPMLINASAIGYYGDGVDELLDETSHIGNGFLSEVTKLWEESADMASEYTKVAKVRTGIVLSKDGGALKKMLLPYHFFVGGPLGSGKQYMSWIHIDDLLNLFLFVIENQTEGIINFVSPAPVTMKEFARTLGKVLNRSSFFSVPEWVLKLYLGESSEMILGSQRVVPRKALDQGYQFKFDILQLALEDILR